MENSEMWIEAPDFLVFSNDLHMLKNRDDLINHLKLNAQDRGFRLMLPYG